MIHIKYFYFLNKYLILGPFDSPDSDELSDIKGMFSFLCRIPQLAAPHSSFSM